VKLPPDRRIDGKDIWPLITMQPGATTPHEAYFYYWGQHLQAVRSGPWKLHFPHSYPRPDPAGGAAKPGKYATKEIDLELFNLERDIGETTNVAAQHPEVLKRLQALADAGRDDLGDSGTQREGKNVRPAGKVSEE
jgi:arylsulfatase A